MTEETSSEPFVEHVGEPIVGSVAEAPVAIPVSPEPAAEPAPATVATERPTDVVIVTLLALLSGLSGVIAGVAWLLEKESAPKELAYFAWASLLIGLGTTALAAILFMGSRIARTLIALFMIIRIFFDVYVWIQGGTSFAVASMISILISAVVLILLFSRESTAFLTGAKK